MHLHCIQPRFDLLALLLHRDRLIYFVFLFSFLFRHLSSLSLLEVGLVGSRPPMEWRPVLSFTSLYIPHVPLPPYLGSLSWYLTTVYTYLLDTFLAIAYVR